MILSRRSLIAGLAASLAAPAVVRAASLMPVRGSVQAIGSQSITLPYGSLHVGDWITWSGPQGELREFEVTAVLNGNRFSLAAPAR